MVKVKFSQFPFYALDGAVGVKAAAAVSSPPKFASDVMASKGRAVPVAELPTSDAVPRLPLT